MAVAAVSLALFAERPAVLFFGAHPDDAEGYAGLAKILRDAKPVAVFTHWPLDAHPDHMQCAALMANAIRLTGVKPEQYFYEVLFSQTRNWNPLYSVDITSVMSNKVELLRKYVCQNPDDSIVREKLAQAEQRGRERVPPVRYAETFTTFDGKPWPGVLEKLSQTVRRFPDRLSERDE